MNTNLFSVLPEAFFNPLTSKYKKEYSDCILLLYNTYKTEISYGSLDREIAQKILIDYFEVTNAEIIFDDENISVKNSRDKANGVLNKLRECGWIEYEQQLNHRINVVLYDYALPFIESMNKVIKDEETEYQGIISQIHATLDNKELYSKPYALILKGVKENTDRLISELKKLDANIKRYIDKQTSGLSVNEILNILVNYHETIGSKAYFRLKTSDNISRFRRSIIDNLERILETEEILSRTILDYMEVENEEDENSAKEHVIQIIKSVIDSFNNLSVFEKNIDTKNSRCIKNATQKAKLELSSGSNTEGKINAILKYYSMLMNENGERFDENAWEEFSNAVSMFPQNYISNESLQTVPEKKLNLEIQQISENTMSDEARQKRIEALKERNKNRFTKKNIDEYIAQKLKEKEELELTDFPLETKRDILRIIYIRLYSRNKSVCYQVNDFDKRIKHGKFIIPNFTVARK